jgi:outer membrane protein assembly factor BamB
MKRFLTIAVAVQLFNFSTSQLLFAQKCVNPHFDAQRLDFRDLGYPGATEIPADSSPITALLAHDGNGKVYGATSGKKSHLFVYDFRVNKVFPLGVLPKSEGVHGCLVEGNNGILYIGTGKNEHELLILSKKMPEGRRAIENQLWADIEARYKGYEGGHLYAYDPEKGDADVYLEGAAAKVVDLGVPLPGESIYALAIDAKGGVLYGLGYPHAELFAFDIATRKTRKLGKWMAKLSYPGPERSWRGVPRALAVDADGVVWSSGDDGLLRFYDPRKGAFGDTALRIPGEYWETQACNAFPVVEQLFVLADGTFIGTTSDGFVFTACPKGDKFFSWGKPRVERRVRAATIGKDGRLYMIAGEKDNVCRLFSFRQDEGYLDWGVLGVDRSPYYAKIAYQFDAMATAADGSILIGESDRRAKLFIFIPGGEVMPGVLNPTNPR